MQKAVECPSCRFLGSVPDTQKTWTCVCKRRWRVARTAASADALARQATAPRPPQAAAPAARAKQAWQWSQFLWAGVLTQFAAGIVFGITVAAAEDSVSDPNGGGIIAAAVLAWIGTIWLLVAIGAWAVQVGTRSLRQDVQQILNRDASG